MNGLTEELADLQERSLRRELRVVTESQGAHLTVDGRSLLNFSSNNYLGFARHPQVVEAVKQVLDHWGAGAASSRLISGSSVIHGDLERALAAYTRREAALLFPTGYMANLGVVTALVGTGDAVIMDRLCHASLVDAARLSGARLFVYDHAQAASAERALERAARYRRTLLVTESLFSMDGDFAPLEALASLARRFKAVAMVDDAHAFGVWNCPTEGWDVVMGTLSKSLGSQGGFVAGSRALIETLINKSRSFIFTTGLSPACVAAAQAALSLVQEDPRPRERVKELSRRLRDGLRALGYNTLGSESQVIPVLLGEAQAALACSDHLSRRGVFAPAIRPPSVHAGECRIRFSVTADHEPADIDLVLNAMKEWKSE